MDIQEWKVKILIDAYTLQTQAFARYIGMGLDDVCDYMKLHPHDFSESEQVPKTGYWIPISSTDMYCSRCHELEHFDTSRKFCARCGAIMVEPQESEDKNDIRQKVRVIDNGRKRNRVGN